MENPMSSYQSAILAGRFMAELAALACFAALLFTIAGLLTGRF